jgi:hypothetical protein
MQFSIVHHMDEFSQNLVTLPKVHFQTASGAVKR